MKTQEVQFGGNNYPCRVVESNEGEELLIGSITLLDALQPGSFNDENEGFASKEAERIYDEVFFFTDMANLRLTDVELVAELKKDNPEWFEEKNNNHLKNSIVMEKEYVIQIAQTIQEQLIGLTPMSVLMSWGIAEFAATIFKGLPALRIKVNGLLHTGYVIIALNGSDYYEVYLLKGKDAECVNEEVCYNELGDVIDRAIECGTDKEEYEKIAISNSPNY